MKAVTCKCKNCGVRFTPKRSSLENSCSVFCAIEIGKLKPVKPNYAKIKRDKIESLETKKQSYVRRLNAIKVIFQK